MKSLKIIRKKLTATILLLSLLSSCMTSFRITVEKPAVIDLPNDVKKLVVIDNTDKGKAKVEAVIDGVLSGEQVNGDKMAASVFPDGVMQSLRNGNYVAERVDKQLIKNESGRINSSSLDSIFKENEAQAIIVLDKFDSDAPIGGVVLGNVLGQSQNTIIGRATISVYCQSNLTMENVLVTERFVIPTSGSTNPLALLQDVVNKRKWYADLGRATGAMAGSYFYSPWVWTDRDFYNKGSKSLRRAKKMIYHGNWDIAEKKLLPLLDSPKEKVQARASYNLALVYEGQGRLDDAIAMAEKSALEFNCKKAPYYLQQLKYRLNDIIQMEWQRQN
jgi:tetratricopeptide (TPR) repeat protein